MWADACRSFCFVLSVFFFSLSSKKNHLEIRKMEKAGGGRLTDGAAQRLCIITATFEHYQISSIFFCF